MPAAAMAARTVTSLGRVTDVSRRSRRVPVRCPREGCPCDLVAGSHSVDPGDRRRRRDLEVPLLPPARGPDRGAARRPQAGLAKSGDDVADLRLQTPDVPPVRRPRPVLTVVQPVVAVLPELERLRDEPKATPVCGARRVVADRRDARLERFPAVDRLALPR